MIHILHISDLHFFKNAASYNTEEILLREVSNKVKGVPKGKKLLIITGDLHNYWDKDYQKAEEFLKRLALHMGLDIKEDVFVVPGNHDVGNDVSLEPLLKKEDKKWKAHQASCLDMLKMGKKGYIEERLQVFRPYSAFVQNLGIYASTQGIDYSVSTHVRCWRGKLNILHLNTALIADGTKKNDQMTDADAAASPDTWKLYYNDKIPSLAIGHNSFFDLKKDQRLDLAGTFALRNISAYLAGDIHCTEKDPERQMIRLESGYSQGVVIPNLVVPKSIADGDDDYSEVGFCWHQWNEENGKVNVEFRKWTKYTLGKTLPIGEKGEYVMRHSRPVIDPDSTRVPVETLNAEETLESENIDE